MSEAQRLKHIADRMPQQLTKASELDAAEPTPDGLGTWEGGPVTLKGANNWVSQKSHAARTADTKNTPGTDYASKLTPESFCVPGFEGCKATDPRCPHFASPLKLEESDNIPCGDAGDDIAKAVASEPAAA